MESAKNQKATETVARGKGETERLNENSIDLGGLPGIQYAD